MAKLPFVVEPRLKPIIEIIGSDASGKIEIERKGYLTAAEKAFTQAQSSSDDSTQQMLALCRLIAKDHKLDMQKAYEMLSEVMQNQLKTKVHETVNEAYDEQINAVLQTMSIMAERKQLLNALCMVLYRVDASLTAEDVMQLHPDLLVALNDLYMEEEARSTVRLSQSVEAEEGSAEAIDALEKK